MATVATTVGLTSYTDAIRYLATHDNSFIRYFEGHEGTVTNLSLHPGMDIFISCSRDNTVRLWNIGTKQWTGKLLLNTPYLSAWDPSGNVFAIACPSSGSILLYDYKNYTKAPFATIDVLEAVANIDAHYGLQGWTKLEFSNDGKYILLGTKGYGHFLFDAFEYTLRAHLRKPEGGTRRAAVGEGAGAGVVANGNGDASAKLESSGDCCFTPDGRYVLSGSKKDVLVWDVQTAPGPSKTLDPMVVLDDKREAAVVAFSPRYNFLATADQALMFWLPDPHLT
jgi:COMPASS component SWD2